MCCRIVWNVSHLKLHYCLRHPIYAVYIDQRPLYALSLHLRAVCHVLFARLCVCVCPCVYTYNTYTVCPCMPAHVPAYMHVGMQHKVLVCAGRHKARPPHPPLPLPWGGR